MRFWALEMVFTQEGGGGFGCCEAEIAEDDDGVFDVVRVFVQEDVVGAYVAVDDGL